MTDLLSATDPYVWLAILGVTAATFITRSSLFVLGARVQFPPVVEAALRFAPACALAAIVAADLAFVEGQLRIDLSNPKLIAGCVGIVIFSITRSIIGTIAGGMITFWFLHFWLPVL
ncbi:MAG: AzlD domain-containing protein [Gammaproteobacteria bacterium]|nr:AzlD domain-containing protein [Gammaproteobacteria bacterium]